MTERGKVKKYIPKNNGVIHAVLWTGKAECLIGLPDFNHIVTRIESIDYHGSLKIVCDGDEEARTVRPHRDYIVVDSFDLLVVHPEEFMKKNYDQQPAEKPPYYQTEKKIEDFTIISADRPDDT